MDREISVIRDQNSDLSRKLEAVTKQLEEATKRDAAASRRVRELTVELEKAVSSQQQQESILRTELASAEEQWFEDAEDLKTTIARQEKQLAEKTEELEAKDAKAAALHAQNKAIGQQLIALQQEKVCQRRHACASS